MKITFSPAVLLHTWGVSTHTDSLGLGLLVLPHPSHQVRLGPSPRSCLNAAIITNTADILLTAPHEGVINANGMLSLFTGLG